jgi:hypothetical protein
MAKTKRASMSMGPNDTQTAEEVCTRGSLQILKSIITT